MVNSEDKSYLGRIDLPRGMRNNNPGNLVKTLIPWKGKINSSDQRFEQFKSYKWGVRAMILDVANDIKKGKDTIESLITEYAPKNENDTDAYINYLVKETAIESRKKLAGDKWELELLVRAIAKIENGTEAVTSEDFEDAYNLIKQKS